MQDCETHLPPALKRAPWNKGKLTGAKPPLRPKQVWSIRSRLQVEGKAIGPGTGMHLQASVLPLPTDMTPCWARFRCTSANACGSSSRPCRS